MANHSPVALIATAEARTIKHHELRVATILMTVYEFPRRDKLGTITITFQDGELLTKEQTGP
jgi:hypothetical protein